MDIQFYNMVDNDRNGPEWSVEQTRKRQFRLWWVFSRVTLVTFYMALFSGPAFSQTSEEAVINQLDFGPGLSTACFVLLDEGTVGADAVLTGALFNICDRSGPSPGVGPSASSGFGAATPRTLPSIVQQRLREARGEEKKPEAGAASADSVVEYANGLGLFISGEFERLDRDVTTFEDGFDSDIWRVTAGADYQLSEGIVAGLTFDYSQQDGDFKGGGQFDVNSYGILGFASFLPMDDVFVQVSGGWAGLDYDTRPDVAFADINNMGVVFPVASGRVKGDYDGDEFHAGVLAGYDYVIGNFTVGPRVGIDWRRTEFESYSQKGNTGLELRFDEDHLTSLQTRVGVQLSAAFRTGFGVIVPQASLEWLHEFENDQRDIKVSFVGDTRRKKFTYENDKPDRNFAELNVGLVVDLPYDLQGFANYRKLLWHSYFESDAGTIGLRVPF